MPVSTKADCADCTWRYWCAGGCPLLTHRLTGRVDVKSPYCDVYGAIYPEVVRSEGLCLLKWGDIESLPGCTLPIWDYFAPIAAYEQGGDKHRDGDQDKLQPVVGKAASPINFTATV